MHHLRRQMSAQVEDCSPASIADTDLGRLSKKSVLVGTERPKEETLEDIS